MSSYHPVEVMGVRVEMPSNQPIVLLKELDGMRYLPIWLGATEATAIAFAQQDVTPPRPLTHDLFKNVLDSLNVNLQTVYLTELKDGIFYAQLNFSEGESISARPSDAIALALRTGSPILASEELLKEAGIEIPDQSEDEIEKFKEFLDEINPEDFLA
ncbi:MAG: bifunctional nuclease family protein [Actinobacteria bacterium]|nr:bifunctional nuclease family protein [Actinomycetota bacterium]